MGKQKVVIKVAIADAKKRSKALQTVAGFHGVSSISEENGQITVVGEGIDPVKITECLRKKSCGFAQLITKKSCGFAQLVTVAPVEEKKEEKKEEEKKATPPPVIVQPSPWYYCYESYPYHIYSGCHMY